jgi:hypothetical protein
LDVLIATAAPPPVPVAVALEVATPEPRAVALAVALDVPALPLEQSAHKPVPAALTSTLNGVNVSSTANAGGGAEFYEYAH